MLYRFKSPVTSDMIMLEASGKQILKIIGKADANTATSGILLPEHMPAAIQALEHAVAAEEAAKAQREKEAIEAGEPIPVSDAVSLRQRASPFITMLKKCHTKNKEVVWGV